MRAWLGRRDGRRVFQRLAAVGSGDDEAALWCLRFGASVLLMSSYEFSERWELDQSLRGYVTSELECPAKNVDVDFQPLWRISDLDDCVPGEGHQSASLPFIQTKVLPVAIKTCSVEQIVVYSPWSILPSSH